MPHPREDLLATYRLLLIRYRQRWPDEEPPPFPDTADLNACVAVNQQLVARLNDRTPITLTVKSEPFLMPLVGEDGDPETS